MKYRILAIVSFVLVMATAISCDKNNEEPESDIIVKEYNNYTLRLHSPKDEYRTEDTLFLDVDNDEINDIMVELAQASGNNPWKSFLPLTNLIIGGLSGDHILYGTTIDNSIQWNLDAQFGTWLFSGGNVDNVYLAFKKVTDSTVNYGWILPAIDSTNPRIPSEQTLTIKKTAYCKTSGKTIFAGQEK